MDMLPEGGSSLVAELLFGLLLFDDDDCSVALAKIKTRDSAPPIPRSRWIKTTSGLVMVICRYELYRVSINNVS